MAKRLRLLHEFEEGILPDRWHQWSRLQQIAAWVAAIGVGMSLWVGGRPVIWTAAFFAVCVLLLLAAHAVWTGRHED